MTKTDSNGVTSYTWDYENRLTSVTLPGSGGTVTFQYDPFGRRIQKSGPTGIANYLYDGANVVTDLNAAGAVVASYAQGTGIDEPLASLTAAGTAFFEADGLGSITSLSGMAGITDTYTYDAFGVTTTTGANPNRFRYTGREWESETGLYYYRARYYDQNAGRFISEDPIGFEAGVNFYDYVSNSPPNDADPSGQQAQLAACAAGPVPCVVGGILTTITIGGIIYNELYGHDLIRPVPTPPYLVPSHVPTNWAAPVASHRPTDPSPADPAQQGASQEAPLPDQGSRDKCKNDCQKATPWQPSQTDPPITDPHQFKEDILGKGAKKSSFDICACKDGSIVLKAVGKCGKPGSSIETGYRWK